MTSPNTPPSQAQVSPSLPKVPGVKIIVAVASGKGGVGKSTTSVNLALALQALGARVGLLDADIYGPNQPRMLGASEHPQVLENQKITPVMAHGLQTMSIGYLIDADAAMVWRGPMVSRALQQLMNDTAWDDLDYLVVDLPPGTGDIQLTLAQKIPVDGVVVVTTPQDVALEDVKKAVIMFEKVKLPILGVVENMAMHVCSECGHEDAIFGTGGGDKIAEEFKLELLGRLPLDRRIREQADRGEPTVVAEPAGDLAKRYGEIANQVQTKLAKVVKATASKFPKIVVEAN